jgi:hypothetical protein
VSFPSLTYSVLGHKPLGWGNIRGCGIPSVAKCKWAVFSRVELTFLGLIFI